jgi:hypothetical protein
MPGNSRMFWKVRATRASLEIRKSFSRSSWIARPSSCVSRIAPEVGL